MSSAGQQKPTRKERREEARDARRALEAQESQRQLRQRRLYQLGGAAVVAAIVIGIAVGLSVSGGKSASGPAPGTKGASSAQKEVVALVSGIPQSGNVLGNPKAPVTMQYFGDLECPICRDFTLGALPSLINNFVRQGKVKIEYRSMQTATREPAVFQQQQTAALAAGKQGLMWYYVELFYHEQGPEDSGYVTPAFLVGIAKQVPGLNIEKWEAERHDPALAQKVEADETAAGEQGFEGTPSFLIGKSGGVTRKLTSFTTQQLNDASALFEPTIEKLLKG